MCGSKVAFNERLPPKLNFLGEGNGDTFAADGFQCVRVCVFVHVCM